MAAYAICASCVLSDPRLVAINMRSDRGSAVTLIQGNMRNEAIVTSMRNAIEQRLAV